MLYGYLIKSGYMGRIGFTESGAPIWMKFPTEKEYREYMEESDEN